MPLREMSIIPESKLVGPRRLRVASRVGPRGIGVALCIAAVFLMRVAIEMPRPVITGDLISCLGAAVTLGWIGATLVAKSRVGHKG
jgi:hypothetical protein